MAKKSVSEQAAEMVAGVDETMHPLAQSLAEELVWQREKLENARRTIDSSNMAMVVSYDNGGGQRGIRKNPMFEAYNAAFKNYERGIAALDSMLKGGKGSKVKKAGKLAQLRLVGGGEAGQRAG